MTLSTRNGATAGAPRQNWTSPLPPSAPEWPASGPMPRWSPPMPRASIPEDPHPCPRRRPMGAIRHLPFGIRLELQWASRNLEALQHVGYQPGNAAGQQCEGDSSEQDPGQPVEQLPAPVRKARLYAASEI